MRIQSRENRGFPNKIKDNPMKYGSPIITSSKTPVAKKSKTARFNTGTPQPGFRPEDCGFSRKPAGQMFHPMPADVQAA
jgi:hypothetical protein